MTSVVQMGTILQADGELWAQSPLPGFYKLSGWTIFLILRNLKSSSGMHHKIIKADGSWRLSGSPKMHWQGDGLGNESVDLQAGDQFHCFHHLWVLFSELTYDSFMSA